MSFITDKQTLDDLSVFSKRKGESIYTIFNHTRTRGGAELLEQLFRYPLSSKETINQRSAVIRFFTTAGIAFPFQSDWLDAAAHYLGNTDGRSRLSEEEDTLSRKLNNLIGADTAYRQLVQGITACIEILCSLDAFLQSIDGRLPAYQPVLESIRALLSHADLHMLIQEGRPGKLSYAQAAQYDKLLRYVHHDTLKRLLQEIYLLDVYLSVAQVAQQRGFTFPVATDKDRHTLLLEGVYHPLVPDAVGNTLHITPQGNIVFLTGANMAGKSTFMKSLGIAVLLAHMGFPVAAANMEFAVRDGMYTTVNLSDNLTMGYSHFYAEVLRVKKVAEELRAKNLFIIFDELFRGTNVKDAYEATVAIMAAFAQRRNCMFVVSTHIMEAGDALRAQCANINFVYLPTRMKDHKPVYTYRLEQGITADRHGMVIIEKEGILEILR